MAQDNKNKILNVPPLRFPEFVEEWKKTKIGNIALKVGSGVTPKGGEAVYTAEGHPFVRSQNVGKGCLLLEDIAYIDEPTHCRQKSTELQLNDVLLNITGASIGRSAVVDSRISGGNVNQHVCIIRLTDEANPFYLCNYLLSNLGQKQIDSFQCGGNRQGLNFEQIKSMALMLPTKREQDKIATLLNLINERIATQNKIIDNLQSLIKGLVERCNKEAHGRHVRLGDILTEKTEKTTTNNQYEVLSSTTAGIYTQREYFNKDIASENNIGYKVVRMYDVVLSPQNLWMGNINYNNKYEIGMVSPSYKVFTIDNHFDKAYIALLLKTHRALYDYALVSEQGASVVRRNLNLEQFYELSYKVPDYRQQKLIGNLWSTYQCANIAPLVPA